MRFEPRGITCCIVCVAVGLLAVGCHAPRAGRVLPKELSGSEPDAQFNYWQQLPDQPITSNDEAFHGLLLYVDSEDHSADYAARVATLKQRKWLPKGFKEPAEQGIKRGTLAAALMRILKDRGGLTTSLIGPIPRYATREMVFLDIFPPSSPNQVLSGLEFVGIMGRVEDFQRGNGDEVPVTASAADVAEIDANTPPVQRQPIRE